MSKTLQSTVVAIVCWASSAGCLLSQSPAETTSVAATNGPIRLNLDEVMDWRNPLDMTKRAYEALMKPFQRDAPLYITSPGKTPEGTPTEVTVVDKGRFPDGTVELSMFSRRLFPKQFHMEWEQGRARVCTLRFGSKSDARLPESSMVALFDEVFGVSGDLMTKDMMKWNSGRFYAEYQMATDLQPSTLVIRLPSMRVAAAMTTPSPLPRPAAGPYFKLNITQINALLITPLASGDEAGQSSKLTLTVLPNRPNDQSWLEFNQEVGGDMRRCLNEVNKHSQIRHSDWPLGYSLQIGFDDKYIEKDGPSAAVACALLVESAITGIQWDPGFAVTGDLNADGSVQPIGGVRAKIRGATNGNCHMVAVPSKNESYVRDILVLDGPEPLTAITVFGIKSFEQAALLANPNRPPALRDALLNFEAMRPTFQRDPRQIPALLRTPQAVERLQALYKAASNCYSAKYLLQYAQGQAPKVLTLGGSLDAADSYCQAIVDAIRKDAAFSINTLKPDLVGNSINKLRNLRPIMDPRSWPYVDQIITFGDVLRGAILNPVRSGARYRDIVDKVSQAARAANAAFNLLMGDAKVREELGL